MRILSRARARNVYIFIYMCIYSEICSLVIKFGQCFILFVDSTNEKYNKPWWQIMLINKTSWTTVRTARNKRHNVGQQVSYSSSGYDVQYTLAYLFFAFFFPDFIRLFSSVCDVSRVPCGATRSSVDVSLFLNMWYVYCTTDE